MSARTAAKRNTRSTRQEPEIVVSKLSDAEMGDEDWYTPKALRLRPLVIEVTVGRPGVNRARVRLTEGGWERNHVHMAIAGRLDGMADGVDVCGTMTRPQLDALIESLGVARDKADNLGLFTPRPTPLSVAEVFGGDLPLRRTI